MAADMMISFLRAAAMCDSLVDKIDVGTAVAQGYFEIRTGAPPADVETADSGTLLVKMDFVNPAFFAAADQTPGARAAVDNTPTLSQSSATGAGTAGHYRVKDRDNVALWQNTAGAAASGEGMELSNVIIAIGQVVTLTSWIVDHLET